MSDGLKVLFSGWSREDLENELMEGYDFICNLPTNINNHSRYKEYKDLAESVLSVMRFMSISLVIPEDVKTSAETLLKECEIRLSTLGKSPDYCNLVIKNTYNSNQTNENSCVHCGAEDSLDLLHDGKVYCFECEESYYI